MLGFNAPKKLNNSNLKKNWPKNDGDAKDDPYEALVLAYNKEMDKLVEAVTISNKVEKEDCETCPDGEMMELDDEEESMMFETPCPEDVVTDEEEEGMESMTPRTKTSYNNANNRLEKIGST
jgi:hypothetical protein